MWNQPSSLIRTSWRLDLTGTRHLSPDHGLVRRGLQVDWRPKFIILPRKPGSGRLITHFQKLKSMYHSIFEKWPMVGRLAWCNILSEKNLDFLAKIRMFYHSDNQIDL